MILYKVVEINDPNNTHYYWAENMRDALNQNAAQQGGEKTKWTADRVWADNTDLRWRGYVNKED